MSEWKLSSFICSCKKSGQSRYTVFVKSNTDEFGYEEGSKVQCANCGRTGTIEADQDSCWVEWDREAICRCLWI